MEAFPKKETLEMRQKYIGGSCKLFFPSDPLKIVRASGQYMYDENGHKYLDCINNVCHVGHCHPDVVEAGCQQMKILNTNNRYLHDSLVILAKKLTETMPSQLNMVYFTNSGSEATDLAVRLAQHHTRNTEMVTLDHAYHGHVISALNISPYKLSQQVDDSHSKPEHVHMVSCPDTYRGKYTDINHPGQDLGQLYADEVKYAIDTMKTKNRGPSFFIAESMQSCGGQIIYPSGYLQKVYKYVRDAGGVCIADEVQVGFGRVGTNYWAFQPQGVVPDIVTVGKPMGNGHPVAAVITTKEISESFTACGMSYFNTYGGNPVSCAIALAVLDVIEKENLLGHALDVGQYWQNKVNAMKSEFDIIGDVRGRGLFIGIDLVKDRKTRQPASEEADYVINRMKQEYIILSVDGPRGNVLKMKPPMCLNRNDVDYFCAKLALVLSELKNMNLSNNAITADIEQKADTMSCFTENTEKELLSSLETNANFPITATANAMEINPTVKVY